MAVLAALLVGVEARVAADVRAVLGGALDDVGREREHAREPQHEDDRAEDAEEERRIRGSEHGLEGTHDERTATGE